MTTKAILGVVLPAGGKGLRLGSDIPKQYQPLYQGKPVWYYALKTLHAMEEVAEIVMVVPAADVAVMSEALKPWPKAFAVPGGSQRWESVQHGVEALSPSCRKVLIHDVARPFLSRAVVRRCVDRCDEIHSVIAALPVADTIKEVSGERVQKTLPRAQLISVQTPQVFPRAILEQVYAQGVVGEAPTDEAQMVEAKGFPVVWVEGDALLRKITTEADLYWATWVSQSWGE